MTMTMTMAMRTLCVSGVFSCLVLVLAVAMGGSAAVAEQQAEPQGNASTSIGPSGLPLPRFVSLKSNRVNVRIGPDQYKYALAWSYRRQGLPVEIIQEYDNWRRIRDSTGETGWVNQALLSGRRTAMTMAWQKDETQVETGRQPLLRLYKRPDVTGTVVAEVEPGVIGKVEKCDGQWCRLEVGGYHGWMQQEQLWGVYPGEKVD